ncbi:MAG TPA: autotransporter domain-containing protein, partial [Caulobacteraceae bacterium]|nr:autotransporter domain-containing protein [Caulobacteraceae bacterium]
GIDPTDDPNNWRQIGSTTPSIVGDIYMGSGNDTLNITSGGVTSTNIAMGGKLNTINVEGTSATNQATVFGAITEQAGGSFVIAVNNGTLADFNPKLNQAAQSINIGANGVFRVAIDPINNQNTQFVVSGTTTIAAGGQIGVVMSSLQVPASETYTVIEGANGSISAPSLGAAAIGSTPFLYTATAAYAPGTTTASGQDQVNLTVNRKTAAQLGFNQAEASAYSAVLQTLSAPSPDSVGIQQALLAQTDASGLKSIYDQLLPNQAQGIFQALDAAVEKVSALTATPPDNATHIGGASLWLQEVNERVNRSGIDTLGSSTQLLGLVGGYERLGAAGGALGVTFGYFNVNENDTAAQIGARDIANLIEGSVYYRRSFGNLTFNVRGGGGFGWFSENRLFAFGSTEDLAQATWTGDFIDAHAGLAYEVKLFGPYYARPEVSVDYLGLHQNGYRETGSASAFNLAVGPQSDTQFTGQALMVLGRQWGREAWFRAEVRGGYREVIDGQVGEIDANFMDGTPFVVAGDPDRGGWMTVGFSLKSGSEFSYLALEGDADLRKGQQRYDLRVAGKSVF